LGFEFLKEPAPVLRGLRLLRRAARNFHIAFLYARIDRSEAVDVFDPSRLEAIIGELLKEVPQARSIGREAVPQVLTAVDGSVVRTLASLAEGHSAFWIKTEAGQKKGSEVFSQLLLVPRVVTASLVLGGELGWGGNLFSSQ
jgi:hypothetical protein